MIRSDEGLTLETSAFRISVRWPIYIINSVDKTKFEFTYFVCHLLFASYLMIKKRGQHMQYWVIVHKIQSLSLNRFTLKSKVPPPVGLEPTTFELEVQHASPLRHGG